MNNSTLIPAIEKQELTQRNDSLKLVHNVQDTAVAKKPSRHQVLIEVPDYLQAQLGTHASDCQLVEATLEGNNKAFELLVKKYQPVISRAIASYASDESTIQDLVQETFVRVYRGLKNYRGDASFYTWIYRIAINTSINYVQLQKRKFSTVDLGDVDIFDFIDCEAANDDPKIIHNAENLFNKLNEALGKLSIELKTVLMLKEMEGLKYDEIAEITGTAEGTVKSRIHRARAFLMHKLEKHL